MSRRQLRAPGSTVASMLLIGSILVYAGPALGQSSAPSAGPVVAGSPVPAPSADPGTWTKGTQLPKRRAETTAVVMDGIIVIPGGLDQGLGAGANNMTRSEVMTYDPATDTYGNLPDMPEPRDHAGIAVWDGKLYVAGGGNFGQGFFRDNLWVFDPATNAWSTLSPMPTKRWQGILVPVDGVLYFIGGIIGDATDHTPVWAYDIATDTWRADVAPMPTQREHLGGMAIDGRIFVIGGRYVGNFPTVEIYDPATDTWTTGPDMPTARGGFTWGLMDGVVHVTGGEDLDAYKTYGQHEGLDLASMTWLTYPDLPNRRHGLMSGVVDDHWYVMGGGRAAGLSTSNLVDVWSPTP